MNKIEKNCKNCNHCYIKYMIGDYPILVCTLHGYLGELDNSYHNDIGEKCPDYIDCNTCKYPNECENCARAIEDRKGEVGMIDREKVTKALELCTTPHCTCEGCPRRPMDDETDCCNDLMKDALTLLKKQEAEIRQLRLALDIAKGTCKGIMSDGGQFADMPTMQSAT